MKITSHKSIPLITAITLILASCSYAVADDDFDDRYDDKPVAERFKIRIGGFLIDSFDTTARFDSAQFPAASASAVSLYMRLLK